MRASSVIVVIFVFAWASAASSSACAPPSADADIACSQCNLPDRKDASADATNVTDAASIRQSDGSTTPIDSGGGPITPKCSNDTPFGAATPVAGMEPGRPASTPRLTPNELAIYFTSTDPNMSAQIYQATRAKRTDPFSNVTAVPVINSVSNDNDPSVSSDGLTLVFHSARSGNNDVWWSKRTDIASAFPAPTMAPGIATPQYDGQGFYFVQADELWFVSDRAGTYDIYKAKRSIAGDTFNEATPVSELNTPQDDFLPWLTEDGKTIYWSSTRTPGLGGQDLFIATRADVNSAFGIAKPISELNTAVTEQAGSISPDNCRIYFSRDNGDGTGAQSLFTAERPLPP